MAVGLGRALSLFLFLAGTSGCGSSPTQPASCFASVPSSEFTQQVGWQGGVVTIHITASASCQWSVQSASSFLTVTAGAMGSGNGTAQITADLNGGPARKGTVTLALSSTAVVQAAITVQQDPTAPTPPTSPTFLWFLSDPGDVNGNGTTRLFLTGAYLFLPSSYGRGFGMMVMARPSGEVWDLLVRPPLGQDLVVGATYTASTAAETSTIANLMFSGTFTCGDSTSHFTILDLAFGSTGVLTRVHMTFDETCNGASAGLRGELWFVQ